MTQTIKIVVVDDSEDDALLMIRALRKGGFDPQFEQVDTEAAMAEVLSRGPWEAVICDYQMPNFTVERALELVQATEEVPPPFIVVSGKIPEDHLVEWMRRGAVDVVSKDNYARLVPALRRELAETERRRQLKQARDSLQNAQKLEAVGQLTGGVAHDFNNLLAVIGGNLDLVRERLPQHEEIQKPLEAALRSVGRGAELTRRLLAFARHQPLKSRPMKINDLVLEMSEIGARTFGASISVKLKLTEDLWVCRVDASELENALLNLMLNARDAMKEGGHLTLTTENVHLTGLGRGEDAEISPGDYVTVSVSDTGIGMPPEVRTRAVEPFYTTKGPERGTGLGLSTVYGFMKQSGGHLEIESTAGQGTTVTLYLPRSLEPEVERRQKDDQSSDLSKGELILVVEDDADVREMVVNMLTNLGYEVHECAEAEAALGIISEQPKIDLLLSDVILTGDLSGPQLAKVAQKRMPGMPVLLMSGYASGIVAEQDLSDGIMDIISKPFGKAQLAKKLREIFSAED